MWTSKLLLKQLLVLAATRPSGALLARAARPERNVVLLRHFRKYQRKIWFVQKTNWKNIECDRLNSPPPPSPVHVCAFLTAAGSDSLSLLLVIVSFLYTCLWNCAYLGKDRYPYLGVEFWWIHRYVYECTKYMHMQMIDRILWISSAYILNWTLYKHCVWMHACSVLFLSLSRSLAHARSVLYINTYINI